MANHNYVSGRNREYKAIALLREQGFECVRAAGSKGRFDVVAWNDEQLHFIQVKTQAPSKAELQALKQTLIPRCGKKEIWIFRRNKALQIVTI